jgi:hypothetical protein
MQIVYTLLISCFILGQTYAQPSQEIFQLEYEGEQTYASSQVEDRYLGEYIQSKGNSQQQFYIKISAGESYLLTKTEEDGSWDLESRQELEWGFISNAEGKPIVLKFQEFSDGAMHTYPAMIFVYKTSGEQGYSSKMLSLRNGALFLDEAPKVNAVAAQ